MTLIEGITRVIYENKKGTFLYMTGSIKNVRYVSGTHAVVQFDNNKYPSKVLISKIKTL